LIVVAVPRELILHRRCLCALRAARSMVVFAASAVAGSENARQRYGAVSDFDSVEQNRAVLRYAGRYAIATRHAGRCRASREVQYIESVGTL